MIAVGALMGEFTPYLERMEPNIYLGRFRELLSQTRIKGRKEEVSESDMQGMWEETLRVTENGVVPYDELRSDSDDRASDTEAEANDKRKGASSRSKLDVVLYFVSVLIC
jgi:hypothetical protein